MNESSCSGKSFLGLISGVGARWPWIGLGLILGVLGAFYYLSKAPESYRATATIFVPIRSSSSSAGFGLGYEMDPGEFVSNRSDRLARVSVDQSLLKREGLIPTEASWFPEWSRDLLGEEEEAPVDPGKLPPAELARMIDRWTTIKVRPGTRLVDISVSHPVPKLAALIANTIAESITEEFARSQFDERERDRGYLSQELAKLREDLQLMNKVLANYQGILTSMADLKETELLFAELEHHYSTEDPALIRGRVELKNKQEHFLREFVLLRSSQLEKDFWESNQGELDQPGLDEATRLQMARRLLATRVVLLENEIEAQRGFIKAISARLAEREVPGMMTSPGIAFIDRAGIPFRPIFPQRGRVITVGIFAGLGGGFFVALLLARRAIKAER